MTEDRLTTELRSWAPAQSPLRIEYSTAVLERIRMEVVDAFYSLHRGGVEVGGVLFGTYEREGVVVLASRPLACEHAFGPSFQLSEHDRAALTEMLRTARREPALRDLLPVGWYHSHTRSEIFLSSADLAIFAEFFPEAWQTALVLRPRHDRPVTAGFFVRESGGSIHSEAPYQEFSLLPVQLPPEEAVEAAEPEPPIERPIPRPAAPPTELAPQPAFASYREAAPPAPKLLLDEPSRRLSAAWIAVPLLILALAGAWFGYPALRQLFAPRVEPLGLNAFDVNGQLLVRWNDHAGPVQAARRANLVVTEGDRSTRFDLDANRLRQGSFTFARRAERVDVRLTLERPGSAAVEEVTSFVGPLPSREPSKEELEARRQRDELAREAERMRNEIRVQSLRTHRLESSLEALKTQLDHERSARQSDSQR